MAGDRADTIALHHEYKNLTIVGDGYESYKHGILFHSGAYGKIKNVLVVDFYHGIVIRSSNVTIDSITAINCGFTSIVVKSAEGLNTKTENVTINHVVIQGDAKNVYKRGGAIMVSSYDDSSLTQNVSIENVYSNHESVAIVLIEQYKGKINNITVKNCTGDDAGDSDTRAGFDIY